LVRWSEGGKKAVRKVASCRLLWKALGLACQCALLKLTAAIGLKIDGVYCNYASLTQPQILAGNVPAQPRESGIFTTQSRFCIVNHFIILLSENSERNC
jgi:hypothetical protein